NRRECAIRPDPHPRIVFHSLLLELEGHPIPDIVAEILLVDQNLVDGTAAPLLAEIGQDALSVERGCDLFLAAVVVHEEAIDAPYYLLLFLRPQCEHHPIGLNALVLASTEHALLRSRQVDQHASKAKSGGAALPEAELDEMALPNPNLG